MGIRASVQDCMQSTSFSILSLTVANNICLRGSMKQHKHAGREVFPEQWKQSSLSNLWFWTSLERGTSNVSEMEIFLRHRDAFHTPLSHHWSAHTSFLLLDTLLFFLSQGDYPLVLLPAFPKLLDVLLWTELARHTYTLCAGIPCCTAVP